MARTRLITGCSRGLGNALARTVLEGGDNLVATARNQNDLAALVELGGDRVVAVALDVTDTSAAARAVATAIDRFGGLDIVVNNAGYGNVSPIEDTSLDDFRAQIETNLFGTIIVTKAAIRVFREQRSGRFIQFSSIGGRTGATGRAPYSAAKFGVEGFSEVLATEMAPYGVKVTIIEPGGFRTDFAGASASIAEGNPAYAGTVGKTAPCNATTMASSLAIRRARPRRSSRSFHPMTRRFGWCWAPMPMRAPREWTKQGLQSSGLAGDERLDGFPDFGSG